MTTAIEHARGTQSAIQETSAFVTYVWEHPLIDASTRAHRERAKTRLSDHMVSEGFSPDEFATVPVGSLLWTVDDYSDYDYLLLMSDKDSFLKAHELLTKPFLRPQKIDLHGIRNIDYMHYQPFAEEYAALFLTPDEYIGGDTSLVADLRLTAVDHFTQAEHTRKWENVVRHTFNSGYRNWDSDSHEHRTFVEKYPKYGTRDRNRRLRTRLDERAAQTRTPERYKQAFLHAREAITVPPIQIFHAALTETQGYLTINPAFAATGIR